MVHADHPQRWSAGTVRTDRPNTVTLAVFMPLRGQRNDYCSDPLTVLKSPQGGAPPPHFLFSAFVEGPSSFAEAEM